MIEVYTPLDGGKGHHIAKPKLFLAGSIEMDTAQNWQAEAIQHFADHDVVILNPRRAFWNSDWEQSESNIEFRAQVEWELSALQAADAVLFYFDPATKSPISLLELGLYIGRASAGTLNKLSVCCPNGFWRKGNVDVTCNFYKIPVTNNFVEALNEVDKILYRNFTRNTTVDVLIAR